MITREQLVDLVVRMRDAQRLYFGNPNPVDLKTARKLEAQVDRCCAEIMGQRVMFDQGD